MEVLGWKRLFQLRDLHLTFDLSNSDPITAVTMLRTMSEVCTLGRFSMPIQVSIPKNETGLNNQYE